MKNLARKNGLGLTSGCSRGLETLMALIVPNPHVAQDVAETAGCPDAVETNTV